jgi:S-(hydroxymethyl)glutathione dehydrogenase/alcohol dehydrogenase
MKTRAAILWQLNKPLIIDDVEIPALKSGQVLVKIIYSGVCRAQYNEMIGLKGPDKFLPHLLGHEASGYVMDTARGVTKVKKNDYVCLSWIKGRGLDAFRSRYKIGSRTINAGAVTTFSDIAVVSENRAVKIPSSAPADVAAISGCAIATGCGIINNTLNASKNSSLVVFGAGGIGLSVILGAVHRGLTPIIAVDVIDSKLNFSKRLGATHRVNALKAPALKKIRTLLPLGADYAVDASGHKSAMENAFACIKDSGVCVIAGNLGKDEKMEIHPFELIKGKRLAGTWGGETQPDRDIPAYLKAFSHGVLPIDRIITHRFGLEDVNKAFKLLQEGEAGRIILKMKA